MPLSSTLSTDSSSGLPLVSTGPQESSQSRHRSLSVDYINQPSSVVKRSSITVSYFIIIFTRIQVSPQSMIPFLYWIKYSLLSFTFSIPSVHSFLVIVIPYLVDD